MRRVELLGVLLLVCGALRVGAQTVGSGIRAAGSHQISANESSLPHAESFLAVDPANPRHLVAASMVLAPAAHGGMRSVTYVSFDGGQRWAPGRMPPDTSVGMEADPVVYVGPSGTALFAALGTVGGANRTIVWRSADGGRTWSSKSVLPSADRESMAIDTGGGPFGGRVYLTGTAVLGARDSLDARAVAPFLARSDDEGRSFPLKSAVAFDAGGADPRAPVSAVPFEPQITSRGVFVLPLQSGDLDAERRYQRDSLTSRKLGVMASNDGGASFSGAHYSATYLLNVTGSAARHYRANAAFGAPRSAIDASAGPYRDRFFLVAPWYDAALDRYVALVWRTGDLGQTWSTAVASDAPRGDVANPAIAVNRDGIVAVTWNDRRDDPAGHCWRLYAAISMDGGEHFLPGQRMSSAPTCTNDARNWKAFGVGGGDGSVDGLRLVGFQSGAGIPSRFPNGGDTQGLAADATGVFHAAWINGETGVMQLWHSSFRVEDSLVAEVRRRGAPRGGATSSGEPAPRGMEDVTNDVRFHVINTNLDFAAHVWTITLEIENRSGRQLPGPLTAVMRQFLNAYDRGGGLKNLTVANADSGGTGRNGAGPTWVFQSPGNTLAPGARTAPRTLRFAFEGGVPEVPAGYLNPLFQVYAPAR